MKIRPVAGVIAKLLLVLAACSLFSTCAAFAQSAPSHLDFSAPRLDAWRILGPGGGGAQFYPAVSPHDPRLVLVACDMTGAYISGDAGDSWRMFNLRHPVRFFGFDPRDSRVIYAGAGGLWRSADRGKTWSLVYPPPASVTRLIMPDDHASPILETPDGPAGSVTALGIDPKDSNALYLAVERDRRSTLYESTDAGRHWQATADLPAGGVKIYIDPLSSVADRTLYVPGKNSASTRRAGHWERGQPPTGVAEFRDVSGGFAANSALTVYAVAPARNNEGTLTGGVLISHDGGLTWNNATSALLRLADPRAPLPELTAVATSFEHPEVAYVSYERLQTGATERDMFHGVARTSDGGTTWKLVWKEGTSEPASNVQDAWIAERFGTGWGEPGIALGVSPTHPEICYRTDDGRTMRTTDGGATWSAVYSRRNPDHTYTTTGLDVTTNYGLFFDPFDPQRLFIAYTDIGLFRSENGGQSWISSTQGVPSVWVNTTYWLVFDPDVKGRAWAAMSSTHDLPRPKMWRHASPSSYRGGVSISEDGGRTWRPSNQGMPPTAVTHLLLDPTSPVNARVLYATGFGGGVFKSVDGGKTWLLKSNGLPGSEPFAWRLARGQDGALYVVIARRSEDGTFGNAADGELFRSRDGAQHWERIGLPQGVNGPNGIAIDPLDPNRLYLAAWGRNARAGAVDGGVFLSTDAGKTWRNVLSRDQHVYDVTVDLRNTRTLYACGFESSAWRSTDRGERWQRIQGYNFKWGHRVITDPRNPAMIYITTYGGSVWYGPAQGDPHAVEDIVTPALTYGK